MKAVRTLLVLALALCAGFFALKAGQNHRFSVRTPPPQPVQIPQTPEPPELVGETITYDVKLGFMKLGRAVFVQHGRTELGGKKADLYTFETKLVRFSDREKIFSDPADALPLRVERDIDIWPKKETITEEYDQQAGTVTIRKNRLDPQVIRKGRPLNNAVLLPFFVRKTASLEPGWSMQAVLPTQQFEIRLSRIEEVTVPAGRFKTYYFESDPDKFGIWISADERRIPVKIKGTGAGGYVMQMDSYTGPREKKDEKQ